MTPAKKGQRRSALTAALFMLGMMTWITFWFEYGRKDDIDVVADAAVSFALYGLSLEGPSLGS